MGRLKIGWGRREISMEEPLSLFGQMYIRISEDILDPLYVTALCLDGGEGQDVAIFCTCDLECVRCGLTEETLQEVSKICPEVPIDSIIMGATHTHTGGSIATTPEKAPDGAEIYSGDKYRAFVARQCAEAICEAWISRSEGGMSYGYGYAVVAHSRRVIYSEDMSALSNDVAPNGHGVMYGNTARDSFSHYEAGADHFLNVMFTFDKEDKLTGMVINVPCPSQVAAGFTVQSADYWAEVRELVKKEYGEDVYVLPQCAAAGDLSPRILHYKKAQARRMELKYNMPYDYKDGQAYNKVMSERMDIAERILQGVNEVYDWAKKDIQTNPTVRHRKRELLLARRKISEEEKQWCEDNIEQMKNAIPEEGSCSPEEYRKAVSNYNSVRGRNNTALRRYKEQDANPTFPSVVHAVRVGDVAFTTTRFELFMDYMHRIQARSPFVQTFVIQLAGDEGGSYLATERATKNKGYSASLFCNHVSYEGGAQLVEQTLEMLEEICE